MCSLLIVNISLNPLGSIAFKDPEKPKSSRLTNEGDAASSTVSAEVSAARSRFWGLGERWWEQLYDGKFHKFGKEVFDKGLHGGDVEPGFYDSAKEANEFASSPDNIMKSPTVPFYKATHKIACRHFNDKISHMTLEQTGTFHPGFSKQCTGHIADLYQSSSNYEQIKKEYEEKDDTNIMKRSYELFADEKKRLNYFVTESDKYEAWRNNFKEEAAAKIAKVNEQIAKRSKELGLSHPMATLDSYGSTLEITYNCTEEELELATANLFAEYDKRISAATSQKEKLYIIADLYQVLEWLHPFRDGQGRTDLTLLAKELVRNGFNPAILEHPYMSTFATLEEWTSYLNRGIEKWGQQKEKMAQENLGRLLKLEINFL